VSGQLRELLIKQNFSVSQTSTSHRGRPLKLLSKPKKCGFGHKEYLGKLSLKYCFRNILIVTTIVSAKAVSEKLSMYTELAFRSSIELIS
jgi:hypothetical protein